MQWGHSVMAVCQQVCLVVFSAWLSCCAVMPVQAAEKPVVMTSIRPLQWLAEALMPPDWPVRSVLPPGQSAHEYQLRPADAVALQDSGFLLWIGPGMEPWLSGLIGRMTPGMSLALLPEAEGHAHESHEHQHSQHEEQEDDSLSPDAQSGSEEHGSTDPHLWLDPLAMIQAADKLAVALQARFPDEAAGIDERNRLLREKLLQLDSTLQQQFVPVRSRGFIVYHDSYGLLVSRYQLKQLAAIWRHEAMPAGVRERASLLAMLGNGQVQCVFHEPEYGRDAVNSWLSSTATGVRVQELDPLGERITGRGIDAYVAFMNRLASDMVGCLQANPAEVKS